MCFSGTIPFVLLACARLIVWVPRIVLPQKDPQASTHWSSLTREEAETGATPLQTLAISQIAGEIHCRGTRNRTEVTRTPCVHTANVLYPDNIFSPPHVHSTSVLRPCMRTTTNIHDTILHPHTRSHHCSYAEIHLLITRCAAHTQLFASERTRTVVY